MAKTVKSTTLTFGLVSAPVKLKICTEKTGTELKTASPDGNPAGYVWVDKTTGELVPNDDEGKALVRKGVFTADGFREVSADQLKAIDELTKIEAIAIDKFIPAADVPLERARAAYFIAPDGPAATKPLVLIREAIRRKAVAGIGKLTLNSKTYPFVLRAVDFPDGTCGLLVNLLEYAHAFAQATEAGKALAGVEVDEKTVGMAEMLLEQMIGTREDLDAIVDERTAQREELIALVLAGETIAAPVETAQPAAKVESLDAMLAASIAAAAPAPKAKAKSKAA